MWQGNLLELPAYMSSADVVVVGTEAQDLR